MGTDFVPTGIATGLSGSIFGKGVVNVITPGAGGAFIPAAGLYYAYGQGAGIIFEVLDDLGNWNAPNAVGVSPCMFVSDAVDVRFRNTTGGNQNVTLIKVG